MTNTLNDLMTKAMEKGYIVVDDLMKYFKKDSTEYQKIVKKLQEEDIKIITHDEVNNDFETEPVDNTTVDAELTKISKSNNSITDYIRDIKIYPLLTLEQEMQLAYDIKQGKASQQILCDPDITLTKEEKEAHEHLVEIGEASKEYFINCNLRLVVWWSSKYRNRGLSQEDIIQEGNMGLMKAVEKFEPDKGVRFSTYASNWIRKSIMRAIQNQARTIRLPIHISSFISRIRKVERALEAQMGHPPTPDEIAKELGEKVDRIKEIQGYVNDKISLDTPVGEEEGMLLGDIISNTTLNPFEEMASSEFSTELHRLLSELNPREYQVITLRFGMIDGNTHTLEEIGKHLGLTRERVRQIESKALRKLRHPARSEKIKQYMQI